MSDPRPKTPAPAPNTDSTSAAPGTALASSLGAAIVLPAPAPQPTYKYHGPTIFPCKDLRYLIRHRSTTLIVVLKEGRLAMADPAEAHEGHVWLCHEADGWYGFKNAISGTFIGSTKATEPPLALFPMSTDMFETFDIIATSKEHTQSESIVIKAGRSGGCAIGVAGDHPWNLRNLVLDRWDRLQLARWEDEWEFVRVC